MRLLSLQKEGERIDERSLKTVLVRCAQSKAFGHPPRNVKGLQWRTTTLLFCKKNVDEMMDRKLGDAHVRFVVEVSAESPCAEGSNFCPSTRERKVCPASALATAWSRRCNRASTAWSVSSTVGPSFRRP